MSKRISEFDKLDAEDTRTFMKDKLGNWNHYRLTYPSNPIVKRPYVGLNCVLLWQYMREKKTNIPFFATFNQWVSQKCSIKKGSKAIKLLRMESIKDSNDPNRFDLIPRWFQVFHISDVFGSEKMIDNYLTSLKKYHHPIHNIQDFILSIMKVNNIQLITDSSSIAKRSNEFDVITMPDLSTFQTSDLYYSSLMLLVCECIGKKIIGDKNWIEKEDSTLKKQAKLVASFTCCLILDRFQIQPSVDVFKEYEAIEWSDPKGNYSQVKALKWSYTLSNQMAKDFETHYNLKRILTFLLCQRKMCYNHYYPNPELDEPSISATLPREINSWIVSISFPTLFFIPEKYMEPSLFSSLPEKTKNKITKKPKLG